MFKDCNLKNQFVCYDYCLPNFYISDNKKDCFETNEKQNKEEKENEIYADTDHCIFSSNTLELSRTNLFVKFFFFLVIF